ncbi:hypothetical protein D3C80_1295060 [compost metagenome]
MFMTPTGMGVVIIGAQVIADGTTHCATHASADGRSGRAAEAVADHRTARRTQAAANRRFCATALGRRDRATRRPAHASANGCTGAAAHLPTDDVTQHPAKTAANRRITITCSQRNRGNQQSKNKRRQRPTSNIQTRRIIALGFRVHGTPHDLPGYAVFEAL